MMADLPIGKIDEATQELLRRRAEWCGNSLKDDLRDTLESLAHEEGVTPDDSEPFGSWLVGITRPGIDLDEALAALRSAPVRTASSQGPA